DLYVANDFGVPDKLYRNNRDGTFTDVINDVVPHTSFSSMGSDIGDVNNDGRIDFLVADMASTTHQGDQRGMADQRSRAKEAADRPRLAPKYQRNALFLNTGTGRMLEAAYLAGLAATDWTWSVRFEDLDNDGWLDLLVTNGMNREQNNADLLRRVMVAETPAERIQIMKNSPVLAQTHLAFRNLGDLRFENVSAEWGLDQKGVAFGAALGDLSGDGNLDLVYANYEKGVTLLRNDSDTGHCIEIYLRGTVSNRFGIGAKLTVESALGTQVRQLTLARGYLSSSEPMVHFGLGNDTSIRRLAIEWPSGQVQTFTDLPVDRRFTITEPSAPVSLARANPPRPPALFEEVSRSVGLSCPSREDRVDETYRQPLIPLRLNRRGPAIAVGDIFGEGRDDVALGGTTLDHLRLLRQTRAGAFEEADSSPITARADADDGPLLLFDAQGQGTEDLLVTTGGDALPAGAKEYQPRLYLNDGHGAFRPAPLGMLPPLPICAGAAAAADFEGNGRLGLFIGGRLLPGQYPYAPASALLANHGGKFVDVTDALAPGLRGVGMVTAALWTDVDGDGWPDLLITLEWGGVRYFHNNRGRSFEDWSDRTGFSSAGTGWWTSIAPADLNGEGRIDYVVGNVGLNTQYHADPAHPALLFSGDFNNDGSEELVEAYYEGDRLYPWRSRRDLGAAIPSVIRRYPQNDFYARAPLESILGSEALRKADRLAATELRSGVFLSQPDGTFRFEALPRRAQIAPFQGLVAGNFLGDRLATIVAAQNSFAPIAVVGRFDGGLGQLLRERVPGRFEAVPPDQSGIIIPGDAKALVVLDLDGDGWPDLLVSRNNDSTLAFRNRQPEGCAPLCVLLRGPDGNPTGIGARVTVEFSDGTKEAAEVCAGSGYYSQSTAACFFGHPESLQPIAIRVRWPTGPQVDYEVPKGARTVTLRIPTVSLRP
ncbi:MAG TPA: FG-GAP-like repeat-containing protein, partial [Opitutaceae bacterium]